jgi:hypothetical protein
MKSIRGCRFACGKSVPGETFTEEFCARLPAEIAYSGTELPFIQKSGGIDRSIQTPATLAAAGALRENLLMRKKRICGDTLTSRSF